MVNPTLGVCDLLFRCLLHEDDVIIFHRVTHFLTGKASCSSHFTPFFQCWKKIPTAFFSPPQTLPSLSSSREWRLVTRFQNVASFFLSDMSADIRDSFQIPSTPTYCNDDGDGERNGERKTIFSQFRNCHTILSAVVNMLFLFCIRRRAPAASIDRSISWRSRTENRECL